MKEQDLEELTDSGRRKISDKKFQNFVHNKNYENILFERLAAKKLNSKK